MAILRSPWGELQCNYKGNLAQLITTSPHFKTYPDKKIFIDAETEESLTCSEVILYSSRAAYVLKNNYGIGVDDVVCICNPNSIYTSVLHYGMLYKGAIISPVSIAYTVDEMKYQVTTYLLGEAFEPGQSPIRIIKFHRQDCDL
jgi:acyl-coenzyme A synthetase/AMP-(fatty) acid ligase